ncbi:MAG: IclR family transcriptional regulator domain-containing protein [Thermoleophilia bacterium]
MKNETGPDSAVTAKAVGRALDIFEFLSQRTHATPVSTLAECCNVPKSSLYNLLKVLGDRRYLTYDRGKRAWSMGPRLFELGSEEPLFAHALSVLKAFDTPSLALAAGAIAERSGLPAAVVARILPLMEQYDLLKPEADGTYTLGLELVSLASRVGVVDRLRIIARPHLLQLRDAVMETTNLVVLDGDHGMYVDQVESRYPLRFSEWVGRRIPLEGSATGRAFADPSCPHCISDVIMSGVTAVAAAVEGASPPAVINVIGPTGRMEEFGLARTMTMTANVAAEISRRLRSA